MPVYSAWPTDAYHPYRAIKSHQADIFEMTKICLEEGRRYKDVVLALLPIIESRALEISRYANEIIDMLPDRPGRGPRPKWFRIAEQVEELASNIALIVDDDLRPALKINHISVIEASLAEIKRQNNEILKSLKSIPRPLKPANLDSCWEEAADIVNEGLGK